MASDLLEEVSKCLWDLIAESILDELQFTGQVSSGSSLPRIWWITTGWINLYLIHAADYQTGRWQLMKFTPSSTDQHHPTSQPSKPSNTPTNAWTRFKAKSTPTPPPTLPPS